MNVFDTVCCGFIFLLPITINCSAGYETYDIYIKNIATGEVVDTIHGCSGYAEWGADDSALFYCKMDSEHRPFEVWLHVLGRCCMCSEKISVISIIHFNLLDRYISESGCDGFQRGRQIVLCGGVQDSQ